MAASRRKGRPTSNPGITPVGPPGSCGTRYVLDMWGAVLGLALLNGLNPLRIGITLLLISRPRPLQNLLFYMLGCLLNAIPVMLIPLALLHFTAWSPISSEQSAVSPGMRNFQLIAGAIALAVAALMLVRLPARRETAGGRHRMPSGSARTGTATSVLDPSPPTAVPLIGDGSYDPAAGGSFIKRLTNRLRNAWESGSLWVATVIGMITGGVPFDGALIIVTLLVTSGTAVGTQFAAAIAFIAVMLVVVEVILVSYLITPTRTLAVLRRLHDWAWAYRRKLIALMFAITGASLLANATGLM
ncbi:GAP family protein [Mycobacterium sp. NPDC050041]|uniref:GAP family protein n=1 Tax=Mycobacterium sp. NPDC050041 TaxID=3364293 RepID=UPI003C2CA807